MKKVLKSINGVTISEEKEYFLIELHKETTGGVLQGERKTYCYSEAMECALNFLESLEKHEKDFGHLPLDEEEEVQEEQENTIQEETERAITVESERLNDGRLHIQVFINGELFQERKTKRNVEYVTYRELKHQDGSDIWMATFHSSLNAAQRSEGTRFAKEVRADIIEIV